MAAAAVASPMAVPDQFLCAVCLQCLADPCTLACGHSFDHFCLGRALQTKQGERRLFTVGRSQRARLAKRPELHTKAPTVGQLWPWACRRPPSPRMLLQGKGWLTRLRLPKSLPHMPRLVLRRARDQRAVQGLAQACGRGSGVVDVGSTHFFSCLHAPVLFPHAIDKRSEELEDSRKEHARAAAAEAARQRAAQREARLAPSRPLAGRQRSAAGRRTRARPRGRGNVRRTSAPLLSPRARSRNHTPSLRSASHVPTFQLQAMRNPPAFPPPGMLAFLANALGGQQAMMHQDAGTHAMMFATVTMSPTDGRVRGRAGGVGLARAKNAAVTQAPPRPRRRPPRRGGAGARRLRRRREARRAGRGSGARGRVRPQPPPPPPRPHRPHRPPPPPPRPTPPPRPARPTARAPASARSCRRVRCVPRYTAEREHFVFFS